jgi:subtilisin family serine protease
MYSEDYILKQAEMALSRARVKKKVPGIDELKKIAETEKESITWAQRKLGIHDLWVETQGEYVNVAVLDTGIDPKHIDLKDAILDAKDFTGEGIEDLNGHGTHCAGIIAARKNNAGLIGVAPKSKLLVAKVMANDGNGSFEWIKGGIDWAAANGAHIISMSISGPTSSDILYKAVHRALVKGVFLICAAGNEGSLYQNSIGYPARYGSVIAVASHDENGNPSGFSSQGGEIDFMAPGSRIWSTYKDGGYAELSGTSMATPIAAGISAMILSKHIMDKTSKTPVLNNEDLRNHLLRMASRPGYHDNRSGYGVLMPFLHFAEL